MLISFSPSFILPNKSSRVIPLKLVSASLDLNSRSCAISFACFSDSKAMNLSPALGTSEIPVTSTGVEGLASTILFPRSSFKVLTLP